MTRNVLSFVSLAALLLFGVSSSTNCDCLGDSSDHSYPVRTVQYDCDTLLNEQGIEDFDSCDLEQLNNGFKLLAKKNFNSSIFSKIDFVGDMQSEVEVTYEVSYYESEGRVTLDVYELELREKTTLLDTIEGLVTVNDEGEADVLFADVDETIYLSDLTVEASLDDAGWWDSFCNWIKGAANAIKEVVVSGLRLLTHVAVKIIGLDGAAKFLNMSKDSNGIYHADFDCWQQIGGYNSLYDFVFSLGSKMDSTKNDFYDQNGDGYADYILWGWKGDYWELGYGGEMGIYKRLGQSEVWYVDKNLAIDMTLKVDYRTSIYSNSWVNAVDWDPSKADGYSNKQWWITGFNPIYANNELSNADLLRATYTVKFVTKGYDSAINTSLRDSFKNKWVIERNRWTFDSSSSIFSYSFI